MIGLEWLRKQKAQRRELATGGLVTGADAASLIPLQGGYLIPTASPAGQQPAAVIEISGVVSQAAEETIRKALTVSPRPRGDAMVACGCWPRYVGACRCGQRAETGV